MRGVRELGPAELCRKCDPDRFDFETTESLADLVEVLGQPRAVAAIEFAVGIDRDGYNVYALGSTGSGKHRVVRRFLEERADQRPAPSDWCYVHNFQEQHKPNLLRLPAGRGGAFRRDLERLVHELATTLAGAFESDEYQNRREALEDELREAQSEAFEALQKDARDKGLATLRTPVGVAFAPIEGEEVISPEDFEKLSEKKREAIQSDIAAMQGELQKVLRQVPRWQRELRDKVRELNHEVIHFAVGPLFEELRRTYTDVEEVVEHLNAVEADVVDNAGEQLMERQGSDGEGAPQGPGSSPGGDPRLRRYAVNVLVDNAGSAVAPVVYEANPTYTNLIGRVEHLSQMGALLTDFTLIKAGALHRANGGYLMLDADRLLRQPFAYEALKRALDGGEVKIESLGQALSLVSTVSLEPEPMPLAVKVVLLGEPNLYYLLSYYDPEFGRLFKLAADFDHRFDRDGGNERLYAQLIATLARKEGLRPFHRGAVAAVVEQSARMVDDGEKLSVETSLLLDLLREADHWAGRAERPAVAAEDVERAVEERRFRANRLEERLREEVLRETLLIDTAGERVGQVNGLSVLQLGGYAFGHPARITARARMGSGEVVNIEREVKLSGPIHSKGVLILTSFLSARYAADRPLSLSASLVFEQSYGGVDGDSASSTELYALLSAISGVALRQGLAVTGSVDQHGRVQAIGGVNQKIEGFFALCNARGLSGDQGVLIPTANVKHLMLRRDVVEAVATGRFHVYPVDDVDQGIELLTGVPAGERGTDGAYPEGTINRRVEDRLAELAEKRKEYGRAAEAAAKAGGETPSPKPPDEPPQPPPTPPAGARSDARGKR